MFIRQCFRKKDGKRHAYWALIESYRSERGPRQRVVAWLGKLDESGRLGVLQAADQKQSTLRQRCLFEEESQRAKPEWVAINTAAVRVENCREFGGPWLAMMLAERLKLDEFLSQAMARGRERVPWSLSALILVIARLF